LGVELLEVSVFVVDLGFLNKLLAWLMIDVGIEIYFFVWDATKDEIEVITFKLLL